MDFRQADQQFQWLNKQYVAGQIGLEQYKAALIHLRVIDASGNFWQMQEHTGTWYVFWNGQWVLPSPPVASPVSSNNSINNSHYPVNPSDIPDWVLVKFNEASVALQKRDIYTLHQIIKRGGKEFLQGVVRYRRTCGPGTSRFQEADNLLREFLNAPTDEFIEEMESRPKKALIGLIVGGIFGFVVGGSGNFQSLIAGVLMFGYFGWTLAWVIVTLRPASYVPRFFAIFVPIWGLIKAVDHKHSLDMITAERQAYFDRLVEIENGKGIG